MSRPRRRARYRAASRPLTLFPAVSRPRAYVPSPPSPGDTLRTGSTPSSVSRRPGPPRRGCSHRDRRTASARPGRSSPTSRRRGSRTSARRCRGRRRADGRFRQQPRRCRSGSCCCPSCCSAYRGHPGYAANPFRAVRRPAGVACWVDITLLCGRRKMNDSGHDHPTAHTHPHTHGDAEHSHAHDGHDHGHVEHEHEHSHGSETHTHPHAHAVGLEEDHTDH